MEENCFSLNTEECYILLGDYIDLTYDEIICLFIYLYFVCVCVKWSSLKSTLFSMKEQSIYKLFLPTLAALPAILVPRGSSSSSSSSGGGGGGVGGSGSDPGSAEDLGSLADLTADSVSDSTSLTSVAPTLDPQPTFPPTESPPPGYMSEDGDSHDLPDITNYSGMLRQFVVPFLDLVYMILIMSYSGV